MNLYKNFPILIVLLTLFNSCSTAQKLQEKAPVVYGDVYFQKWAAGTKEGGSGIHLFIPIKKELPRNMQLDSVYFRGKGVKLETIEGENIQYIGRFKTNFNQKSDVIMSNDPNKEYGNQAPIIEQKIPFDLKDSECVVSYIEGNETKYFKIGNIIEKQAQNYPSAPNRQ